MMKRIAISTRVVEAIGYNEARDALAQDWVSYFNSLEYLPLLVPNNLTSVETFLNELSIDGILLTGGNTVGLEGETSPPKDVKSERDTTEGALIDFAINKSLPLLGVCRGMQMINRYFGGTVTRNISSIKGLRDNHVSNDHEIEIISQYWKDMAGSHKILVNSYHDDGLQIDDLAENIIPMAKSTDGLVIEALEVPEHHITGIEWHIERTSPSSDFDRTLLTSIFGT
jgi:gamma-glutamyl-gamma-aminobutyrate hydrolase PuuD